jgi:protein-tyrosine phosphatase
VTPGECGVAGADERRGVLVLCTANICRSPMAAALLRRQLTGPGAMPVTSAGLLPGGRPVLPEVLAVMNGYGLDLSGHVSRTVSADDLAGAGLVLAMSREHLRHAVVTVPECWPRAFTLKELIRRGERAGMRRPEEPLAAWLPRTQQGREMAEMLGASAADDVADPLDGPPAGYGATAALLDRLTARLASVAGLCPGAQPVLVPQIPGSRPGGGSPAVGWLRRLTRHG